MIFCHKNLIYLFSVITEITTEISADFDQFLNQLDKTESTSRNLRFTTTSTVVGRAQLDILRHIVGRQFLSRLPPQNTPFWLNSAPNQLIHSQNPSRNSQLPYAKNAGAPKNKKNEKTFF